MRVKGFILIVITVIALSACSGKKNLSESKVKVKKELGEDKEQQYYYVFLEANRKKLLGDLNGALALYYQCLEINPTSAAAMAEISKINEVLQNYEVAIKYAISAFELEPTNKWYGVNLAKLYIVTNDYPNAIKVYSKLKDQFNNDIEISYNLATLYTRSNNFKQSIEIYNEIEKRTGVRENLSIRKQQLYQQIGQKSKAYQEIEKLIKYYPGEPRYRGIIAEMYTSDNLFLKAEENYIKLFELDSTNALGQLSIIDFYRKKMDYENVFVIIRKVIDNNDIDYNQKVLVFVSLLNTQSEFNIYNEQIKNHLLILRQKYIDKKDSHTLYADYLIKMNQLDEARTELEYIIDNYSGNVIIWEQLLSIYSFKNDFESLYIKSKIAIDSFPGHSLFYLFSGVSANQTEKTTDAIEILKNGLKTINNNPELEIDFYTNLGEAYHNNNEFKQSDYYFDLVLQKEPDNLYVINNYSYYLSLREEKLEYAESISKKTIEAEPKNSTFLDTYAWILYKLEKYQDALYYIKIAIENGGLESNVIVEHYGDIEFKMGNKERAIELWKLSKEMGNLSKALIIKIESGVL